MLDFLFLCLPIFGIVGLGWAATKAGWASDASIDVLGWFSFRFALPALVLKLLASQSLDTLFDARFYVGLLGVAAAVFLGVLLVSRRLGFATPDAAAHATTASVSNLGFLGPPLMLAFFGDKGAGPLAMAIMAEVMVILTLGSLLMSLKPGAAGVAARQVLQAALANPLIGAIICGVTLAGLGISLPQTVDRFLGFLGAAAGPTALFALGAALARQRFDRAIVTGALAISAVKLALYPALLYLVLAVALGLDAFWWQAGLVIASLPAAGNIYVVAQRHATDPSRVSSAIVLSTVLSVVTVPLVAWLAMG